LKLAICIAVVGVAVVLIALAENAGRSQPRTFAPRIAVLPNAAKVFVGRDLQFRTALVGNTQTSDITWSVVGPGSIDRNGLYHAAEAPATADVVADAGGGLAASVTVASVRPPKLRHPMLLSTCYEDGTINVWDARTRLLNGAFSVGGQAAGIAVDARAGRAFIAADAQLLAVDLASMRWRASSTVSGSRFSEVTLLAGGYIAVTDNLAASGKPGVRIFRIDASGAPTLVSSVAAGETPEGIASADGGHTFYVTSINSNLVMRFAIDSAGRAHQTGVAQTATRPFGVAVDPVHHVLFVADNDTATLSGSRAHPGLEVFALPRMRRMGNIISTGSGSSLPLGVAVDPSEARLFVTNEGLANVAVFAIPSLRRIATLPAALTPWLPSLDAQQHRLYVPNARANSISVYDTHTLRAIATPLATCSYPTSVAVYGGA